MRVTGLALVTLAVGAAAADVAPDAAAVVDRADTIRVGLTGVSLTAVHEVTDTAGRTESQVYTVLNHLATGDSYIVISSENADIDGMVFLVKGSVLYAAPPSQRSFTRLGSLNLDRRIAGSLFSHWDLQGNLPLTTEYNPTIANSDGKIAAIELGARPQSHYRKITGTIDLKVGLFTAMSLFDDKGLLKTVALGRPRRLGTTQKRLVATRVEMTAAPGRTDLPVTRTTLHLMELELDPRVDYGADMAATDANLQRLRSRHILSADARRSLLAEARD